MHHSHTSTNMYLYSQVMYLSTYNITNYSIKTNNIFLNIRV